MKSRDFESQVGDYIITEATQNGSKAVDVRFLHPATEDLLHTDQLVPTRPVERQEVTERLLKVFAEAATLPPDVMAAIKTECEKHLNTVGAQTMDRPPATTEKEDSGQGVLIEFKDPDPHGEAVNGADLLDAITHELGRFVAMSEHSRRAVALWIVLTYVHDLFSISPILALVSPTKRCGKTTLLGVVAALVRRPLAAANATPASIFRVIGPHSPTLLLDEVDTLFQAKDDRAELRGMLNSGHSRPSANIMRTVGEDYEPRLFPTWCPKLLAKIGDLPDTLQDRAVVIPMERKLPTDKLESALHPDDVAPHFAPLRSKLKRWADDNTAKLRRYSPTLPPGLNDRARDNWRPLLAIAEVAGGAWPEYTRKAAPILSGDVPDDEEGASVDHQLLADLIVFYSQHQDDGNNTPSVELCEWLRGLEDRPWKTWGKDGRGMAPRHLAQRLRPFRIRPRTINTGEKQRPKGYVRAEILSVCARYLPSQTQLAQPECPTTTYVVSASATGSGTLRIQKEPNLLPLNDVADVAATEGVREELPPVEEVPWP
jgi:putative DNA primase/helicase